MRALASDQRIAGVSYGWEGRRNESPSVMRMNGTIVRRNLNSPTRVAVWDFTGDGVYQVDPVEDPRFSGRIIKRMTVQKAPSATWTAIQFGDLTADPGDFISISFEFDSQAIHFAHFFPAGTNLPQMEYVDRFDKREPSGLAIVGMTFKVVALTNENPTFSLGIYANCTHNVPGDSVTFGSVLIEKAASYRPYFDGDTQVTRETINDRPA